MQTESPALLSFQHWKHLLVNPGLVMNVVGDEGVVAVRSFLLPLPLVVEEGQEEVEAVG